MKSSIIDVPRKHTQEDLFGIQVYQNALIRYVKLTDTPITIALQGEWGSGKTSLMNLLKYNLCDKEDGQYFPIWINTWQYSLMKTPSQAIMSILEGIIKQIGELNPSKQKWEESRKKIGGIFKKKDKDTPHTSTATREQNISVKGGETVNINVKTVGNEQVRINLSHRSLGGSEGKPTGNRSAGNNGANTGKSTADRQNQSK